MKVLHLMVSGEIGGIEVLMKNYSAHSVHENIFLFLWNGGEIAEEMKKENRDVRFFDIRKAGMFKTLAEIRRLCKNERIDVMMTHHNAPFLKLAILWLNLVAPAVRNVAYKHGTEMPLAKSNATLREHLAREIHRWGFLRADGVVAISGYVKNSLVHHLRIPAEKIRVLYNGVPVARFCSEVRKLKKMVKLIYVGRLTQEKGVQTIIRAVKTVSKKFDVTLDIVGDGEYRTQLEQLTEQLELTEVVHFCGASRNVAEHLADADIFIHTPECEEGFGITVVEAMAAGCLCVCAAKGGIPEIIHHGVDGVLVPEASEEALAQSLLEWLPRYCQGECRVLQERAVVRAEEFSICTYSKTMDSYLENLTARK